MLSVHSADERKCKELPRTVGSRSFHILHRMFSRNFRYDRKEKQHNYERRTEICIMYIKIMNGATELVIFTKLITASVSVQHRQKRHRQTRTMT